MSNKERYSARSEAAEGFLGFVDTSARLLFWAGLAALVISIGFLVFTFMTFNGPTQARPEQALANIDLFQKVLMAGVIAAVIGSTYMHFGEETLGPLQLGVAAALYFSPAYLPLMLGGGNAPSAIAGKALGAIQFGGLILGILAIAVLVFDVSVRIKDRSKYGSKADLLKYGKGVKEEPNVQNVFMGKCWQLPFCRKFVRQQCPIYHSKRTCWKERVGCMCEETVIQSAMEGKPIPKDAVAAAKFIPVNNRLTMAQKAERCKQCVIYNEHQRHKYKLWMPVTAVSFVLGYVALRPVLLAMTSNMLRGLDSAVGKATFRTNDQAGQAIATAPVAFQEILLACMAVVVFAYVLKLLEFLIFKAKV